MPRGCVRLTLKLMPYCWKGEVERDGKIEEQEFIVGDLRPLTASEIGPRGKR